MNNRFGSYTYGSVTNFALDFSGTTDGRHWQSYSQAFGNPLVDFTFKDVSFFAQDQFKVNARLSLNYGVRYEYSFLPQPPITNPDYPQTGRIPSAGKNWAPRLGVAYSLNSKTLLRAGYGIFFARYQGGLISTLWTVNNLYTQSLSFNSPTQAGAPAWPKTLASPAGTAGASSINFAAPDMRNPYTQQGDVAVERSLGKATTVTVSYIWSRGLHLYTTRDLNIGPLSNTIANFSILDASGNAVGAYSTPLYLFANRVDRRYTRVNQIESGGNTYYNGLAVQLRKRFSRGFQGSLAYTWSHAIDFNQGGGSGVIFFSGAPGSLYNGNYRADKGSASLDQRHRLVMTFVGQPTFNHRNDAFSRYVVNNWQLSGLITLASARPTQATITSSLSASTFPGAFTGAINGFGGDNRVPFFRNNSVDIDQTYRADLRLSKLIPFRERFKLYLTFEVFNLTNTITNTNVFTTAYTASNRGTLAAPNYVLTPVSGLGVGSASGGFPDGTNARRAQVAVRFVF